MVIELEGDAGGLVKRTLDDDYIIDLWLESFEDNVELPSATTALVDYEFSLALKWSQRLESHLEAKWVVWAHQSVILLLKEDGSLNQSLLLRVLNVEFVMESVRRAEVMEAWEHDSEGFIMRLTSSGLEVVIDLRRGTFSNTSKWILPHKLFAHAYHDHSSAFSHRLWRERIWNLQDTERTNAELVTLKKQREYLGVVGLHMNLDCRWLLEWILE